MSNELELKKHPGRHGNDDEHLYKRTHSLDVRMSPVEMIALKESWNKTEFNSMASFVRNLIFKGNEKKIDFYYEDKQQDRILLTRYFSELNKQGKNINQIAKQLNSKPEFMTQEVKILIKNLMDVHANLVELKDEISKNKKN
jgi:hypothetical protein